MSTMAAFSYWQMGSRRRSIGIRDCFAPNAFGTPPLPHHHQQQQQQQPVTTTITTVAIPLPPPTLPSTYSTPQPQSQPQNPPQIPQSQPKPPSRVNSAINLFNNCNNNNNTGYNYTNGGLGSITTTTNSTTNTTAPVISSNTYSSNSNSGLPPSFGHGLGYGKKNGSICGSTSTLNSFNLGGGGTMTPISMTGSEQSPIMPRRSRSRSSSPLFDGFCSNFDRPFNFPQTEEDHLYLFHEKIIYSQERSLIPLCHDLADWINSILGTQITPCSLMENLETGSVLCQLAKLIQDRALQDPDATVKPMLRGRFRITASKGSFFARDNISIFINFCKELGVHENLLFETEDLVSHGELRSVLVCLMEVARQSMKYGFDPPSLVAFENQIDEQQREQQQNQLFDEENNFMAINPSPTPPPIVRPKPLYPHQNQSLLQRKSKLLYEEDEEEVELFNKQSVSTTTTTMTTNTNTTKDISTNTDIDTTTNTDSTSTGETGEAKEKGLIDEIKECINHIEEKMESQLSDSIDSGLPVEDQNNSLNNQNQTPSTSTSTAAIVDLKPTDLDLKVNEVTKTTIKHCCCIEETQQSFKLRKLSEGKYYINGRTVFVRLLKGVHVMVRIGGGWETLEEFLVRNDPCRNARRLRGDRTPIAGPGGSRDRNRKSSMGLFNSCGGSNSGLNGIIRPASASNHISALNYTHSHSHYNSNSNNSKPHTSSTRKAMSACSTPRSRSRNSLYN